MSACKSFCGSWAGSALDALHVNVRPAQCRSTIAQEVDELLACKQRAAWRQCNEGVIVEQHAQGKRVTLAHLANFSLAALDRHLEPLEICRRQVILEDQIALRAEALPQLRRSQGGEQPPA